MPPHRADIRRPDGFVVELQHSAISAKDIGAREAFYGNMCWLFHRERFGKKARFYLAEERVVRLRWLNGSRTLPLVTKPMFCDLGGPIVEFTQPVDRTGGWGRLFTRSEFLARIGLAPLDSIEKAAFSHYEVRWPARAADRIAGVVVTSEAELEWWRRSTMEGRSARACRLDDTHQELFG